MFAHFYS